VTGTSRTLTARAKLNRSARGKSKRFFKKCLNARKSARIITIHALRDAAELTDQRALRRPSCAFVWRPPLALRDDVLRDPLFPAVERVDCGRFEADRCGDERRARVPLPAFVPLFAPLLDDDLRAPPCWPARPEAAACA
jgi:hypothetical protein